jgi:hypothetical protein
MTNRLSLRIDPRSIPIRTTPQPTTAKTHCARGSGRGSGWAPGSHPPRALGSHRPRAPGIHRPRGPGIHRCRIPMTISTATTANATRMKMNGMVGVSVADSFPLSAELCHHDNRERSWPFTCHPRFMTPRSEPPSRCVRRLKETSAPLPQHADEHRPQRPVLLAVDQLGEGASLRVAAELSDQVDSTLG